MRWYAISGSWRIVNKKVKEDVKKVVEEIVLSGGGILTGGALGVDYIATQTVLRKGSPRKQLRLYLPISLEKFCEHYFRRAEEGIITKEQAEKITFQLRSVHTISPDCIFDDWGFSRATKRSYYARNTRIIKDCDELYAFHVNDSLGTLGAIRKAKRMGKRIHVRKYYIRVRNKKIQKKLRNSKKPLIT